MLNEAVVLNALAFPNVTVPGPLTFDQVLVRLAGGLGFEIDDAKVFHLGHYKGFGMMIQTVEQIIRDLIFKNDLTRSILLKIG